jgi:hypothetical protein
MNKEQEQIIDEEYALYLNESRIYNYPESFIVSQEEFINKCKTDTEFSETWGLKIEERELSLSERGELFRKTYPGKSVDDFAPSGMEVQSIRHQLDTRYNKSNIPTKLITITYNNKTIESYE